VSCCLEHATFIPHIWIMSNETGIGEKQHYHCSSSRNWMNRWANNRCRVFYSRKMVNYISDTRLTSMANQSTQGWVNISGQPQGTSIPVHGRRRGHSSMLDTWKVNVCETGVVNLHQVRKTSLREMGQQVTQLECTSDSPPLACCSGYLSSPFPCNQTDC
jgi:hypothetical protein